MACCPFDEDEEADIDSSCKMVASHEFGELDILQEDSLVDKVAHFGLEDKTDIHSWRNFY